MKCELCYVTKPAKNKAAEKDAAGDAGDSGSSVSEEGAGGEEKPESDGTGGEQGEKKEQTIFLLREEEENDGDAFRHSYR